MKKFLVLILAILYVGSSTGATFHLHYCMGKLVKVQLWHEDAKRCSNCGMNKKKQCARKCCRDEHKTVKLEKDQKAAENTVHFMQLVAINSPVFHTGFSEAYPFSVIEEFPLANAPPRSSKVPSRIFNCIFRV
ncbi:hypothetical protein L3C95_17165 [Chitinophaga filiformis]|uniref:HYC_CC_PP family protein n=1 Tax=Chitinophaga filiformis TaxID=104663 RepID=UPI001F45EE88|nr:hypothetical protein [Chitinophaga filiformis]MCF6404630.1 hypothetical protein [Chitinophaga filiformis]